jgi:hypothetical protein
MNLQLDELNRILEEEVTVGEQLSWAIKKQRQAFATWDVEALFASIELRQAGICRLSELEARRRQLFEVSGSISSSLNLREIIHACREESLKKERLRGLRLRAREIFLQLRAEERDLLEVMMAFRSHFHRALNLLTTSSMAVYCERGMAVSERPTSALMCHKA